MKVLHTHKGNGAIYSVTELQDSKGVTVEVYCVPFRNTSVEEVRHSLADYELGLIPYFDPKKFVRDNFIPLT